MIKQIPKFAALIFFLFSCNSIFTQTATFITLDDAGNLHRVSVGSSGCTSTPLNLCNNITGNPLSIALDGTKLYIVDNKGNLYKNTLGVNGTVGNCTKIGNFPTTTSPINGLTVGNGGIVYGAVGSKIETYNPATNTFATLGSIPSQWTIGGDLLFYKGVLYEAVKINNSSTNCALIQINLSNVANSTLYMNFNAGTNAFGFASVTVPCSANQAYALSNGTTTTSIYAIDMTAKTEAAIATCTLNYNVYDAASIAETQSAIPPTAPTVTSPINYCLGQPVNPLNVGVAAPDTLRWYKQAVGGNAYGVPTPAVSSAIIGTTNYYVSNFDTSTGCESDRSLISVIINPYPNTPTINPGGSNTICFGDSLKLTSSAITGNQWYFNGNPIIGATNQTYYANANGSYTVTLTGVAGCSRTSVATIVNMTNATISYLGSPFCNKGIATVTQTGEAGGTYTATPSGLSINSSNGSIDLAASATGTYTITYTVGSANCNFSKSIQVVSSSAGISYSSTQYCKSSAVQNVAFATGSTLGGTFTVTPSGLSIDATTGAITPSTSQANTYTITYTYGIAGVACGVQTTTTNISILDKTSSTTNKSICNGDSILFNGTYYKTAGFYSFNTSNAAGCDSIANLVLIVNQPTTSTTSMTICKGDSALFNGTYYSTAGNYSKTLVNASGCDSIASLVLTVENFNITLLATPNPVNAATNLLAQITANTTIASSVWQPSNFFINNISTQNIKAPNNNFTIQVNATSVNGCVDSATKLITVINENENVYIPNAFIPLNAKSTENLSLKVYGTYIKNARLDIYNQWGEKIKTLNDATNLGWDGTVRGKQQPIGVYIYIATITFQNNKTIYKKGSVNLLR